MKYELPQMDEAHFMEFYTFVLSCFDQGRQRFQPQLRRITTEKTGYSPHHEAYLRETTALAVAMEGMGDYQKEFDIWVNPAYGKDNPRLRATLAHELVHGYAGLKYGHNTHWRRWYYRVLYHLQHADLLGLENLPEFVYNVELSYNQVSVRQGETLIIESANKAKEEHAQVLKNYWKRILGAPSSNLL